MLILVVLYIDPVDQLTSFEGLCRYGNNNYDLIGGVSATSAAQCYEKCKANSNNECVAFAYSASLLYSLSCNLYRGGPYKYGDDTTTVGNTCYVMRIGIFHLAV